MKKKTNRRIAWVLALAMLLTLVPGTVAADPPIVYGCGGDSTLQHDYHATNQFLPPACTIPGWTLYTCSRPGCGDTYQEEIPAPGHQWDGGTVTTAPTCTAEGLRTYTCTRLVGPEASACGETYTEAIPALGHDWGGWTTVQEPTCTAEGSQERVCSRCGGKEIQTIPALGHSPATVPGKAATCTETGLTDGSVCSVCGATLTAQNTIPAAGHSPVTVPGKAATCTEAGLTDGSVCSVCGATLTAQNTIPAAGHSPVTVPGKAATCTEAGLTDGSVCSVCGATLTAQNTIPATGHDWGGWYTVKEATATEDGLLERDCRNDASHREFDTIPATPEVIQTPFLTVTPAWADDAGEGKRYEGAEVEYRLIYTNAGTETIRVNNSFVLQPGETKEVPYTDHVWESAVESGEFHMICLVAWEKENNPGGEKYTELALVHFPLTYPGITSEKKPGLKLILEKETVQKTAYEPEYPVTADQIFDADDDITVSSLLVNTGNVPVRPVWFIDAECPDGHAEIPLLHNINPSDTHPISINLSDIGGAVTPGTGTAELLGILKITQYVIGYDPDTFVDKNHPGTELCRSETIVRTYKVRGDGLPTPAAGSQLTAKQTEVSVCSDPAGYQLTEPYEVSLTVTNSGTTDILSYTAELPFTGTTVTGGPIAAGESQVIPVFSGNITKDDVVQGYIWFPAITVKWTDPGSGAECTTQSGGVHLTVLDKVGLLLKNGLAHAPANGAYFTQDEQIDWTLDVTNNSEDPITDISVTDKGVPVGSFPKLDPGEKKDCTVPPYTVTEYDAVVTGYVINYATAVGTDLRNTVHHYPSNPVTAKTRKDLIPIGPGGGEDPLGPLWGVNPALSIVKTDAGPANGAYYEAGEQVTFYITVTNTGDCELKDLTVTDSLAGFTPIATLASLPAGDSYTFTFIYQITEPNMKHGYAVNSATVTYTFLDGVHGTPMPSNKCWVICGENGHIPTLIDLESEEAQAFDPELLRGGEPADTDGDGIISPEEGNYCVLNLDAVGQDEALYTLHLCTDHREAAQRAEDAALAGDWKTAADIWRAEVDGLYERLWLAGSDEARADLLWERTQYFAYIDSLAAMAGDEAAAEALHLKCTELCCMIHTFPDSLPDSITGEHAELMGSMADQAGSSRTLGAYDGSGRAVTETYAGPAERAWNDVLALLESARSYDADKVFARGQILWKAALDEIVNPCYLAADEETRKKIGTWRIALDSQLNAERPFLELVYPANSAAAEEILMNLYRTGALEESMNAN